jgi:hypothetical protein
MFLLEVFVAGAGGVAATRGSGVLFGAALCGGGVEVCGSAQ